jgi:LysM repeat protein
MTDVAGSNYYLEGDFLIMGKSLKLSASFGDNEATVFTASLGDLTLPEIAGYLISLVDKNASFQSFPSPWDFLDDINFKGLKLKIEAKSKGNVGQNRIGISYPVSINLEFVKIENLEMFYNTDAKKVQIELKGELLGKPIEGWDIYPPGKPPDVPGVGNQFFDLKFLGMGQHISIKDAGHVPSVQAAIGQLEDSFKSDKPVIHTSQEGKAGELIFSPETGWLIGTRFIVIKTVDLSLIFNDPYLYGIALQLAGPKAKTFAGLYAEIMYRKITDSIGVFSLELRLPDAMRQMDFGALSFTLPVIGIEIFTNGDFRIDLGFPKNNDWARTFTVQFFPFIGAGGFYFAMLSGATAPRLPSDYDPSSGTFKPVIDFGIAMRLGIGKEIRKGILNAGISITFQGIVTGTLGFFTPGNRQERSDDLYYYLNGQFQVVGKIFGEIDFAIITARLDVTVYAAIGVIIEAYREIILYLEAGVSLQLTVRINLGLFKVSVSLSFSTSVSYTFTLPPPKNGSPQWTKRLANRAGHEENPFYISLVAPKTLPAIRSLQPGLFQVARHNKEELVIWFLPQFSTRTHDGVKQNSCFIAGLFLDAGNDNHAGAFGQLCRGYLRWLMATYQSQALQKGLLKSTGDTITIQHLKQVFEVLSQPSDGIPPVSYDTLLRMLNDLFDIRLRSPQRFNEESLGSLESEFNAGVFPMIPSLEMKAWLHDEAPFATADFSANPVSSDYHRQIQAYFAELNISYRNKTELKNDEVKNPLDDAPVQQSLAKFIFQDYFVLLGRNLVQECINLLESYPYETSGTETLSFLQNRFNVSAADIVISNSTVVLSKNRPVVLEGVTYIIQNENCFFDIPKAFRFSDKHLYPGFFSGFAELNKDVINLFIPGQAILIPIPGKSNGEYIVKDGDTLSSIIESFKGKTKAVDLVMANGENKKILSPFTKTLLPSFTITTSEIDTFASLATLGLISLQQLAKSNASGETHFFRKGTVLNISHVPSVDSIETLIAGLTEKNIFTSQAGMAARYFLHGLRLPAAGAKPGEDATFPLYELTGQLFDFPSLKEAQRCTISLTEKNVAAANPVRWFSMEKNNAVSGTELRLDREDLLQVMQLEKTLFTPQAINVLRPVNFRTDPSRFMLRSPSAWQTAQPVFVQGATGASWPGGPTAQGPSGGWWPYSPTGVKGPTGWIPSRNPNIWMISDEMKQALADTRYLQPALKLFIGRNNTATHSYNKEPVDVYGWGTVLPVTISLVPSVLSPGTTMPAMYAIESMPGASMQLLQQLLSNQYDPSIAEDARATIGQVHLLYPPNLADQNPKGLRSNDPSEITSGIIQCNLSTLNNPELRLAFAPGKWVPASKSFNQDPVPNLRRLWEATLVKSGGFYLYYRNNETGEGLPSSIFNDKGQLTLNLVITFALKKGQLFDFVNSVVLGEPVPDDAYLFAESVSQKAVVVKSQQSVNDLLSEYRVTIDQLAEKTSELALTDSETVLVEGIIFLLDRDDYTLSQIAAQYSVTPESVSAINPGIDFQRLRRGEAIRIPVVAHKPAGAYKTLGSIANRYGVPVVSLLWTNRRRSNLFVSVAGIELTDQSVTKSPTLIPGNTAFELVRINPEHQSFLKSTAPGLDPQLAQNLNYNLLTYAVKNNPSFAESIFAMPVSPENKGGSGTGVISPYLVYNAVVPVYPFAKSEPVAGTPVLPVPEQNPYRGAGDIFQVEFEWQDSYGNRTISPFTNPSLYPVAPFLNDWPQAIAYSDTLINPAQWPSMTTDHLFLKNKNEDRVLELLLAFDPSRYCKGDGNNTDTLAEKARTDRETYRKAIYQLSGKGVSLKLTTTLDADLDSGDILKHEILRMLSASFHYLDSLSNLQYHHVITPVEYDDAGAVAAYYRLSKEFIIAQNPGDEEKNTTRKFVLPANSFYLYYTQAEETLDGIAEKLNCTTEAIAALNPGVKNIPGPDGILVAPCFYLPEYITKSSDTFESVAAHYGISVEALKAANPQVPVPVPAQTPLLLPLFSCRIYEVLPGDTLKSIASRMNIAEAALNATTSRHERPLLPGSKIIVPVFDFVTYVTEAGDTLESISSSRWVAAEVIRRINPEISFPPAPGTLIILPETPAPYRTAFKVKFNEANASIFQLKVNLDIERDPSMIDPFFLDQREVRCCSVPVSPRTMPGNACGLKDAAGVSLRCYANYLEDAFEDVALAMPGKNSSENAGSQLYIVRLKKEGLSADPHILSYKFQSDREGVAGNLNYYAPVPLATYPLGATFDQVPGYTRGIGLTGASQMTFAGMELDIPAASLLGGIDELLQPDLTSPVQLLDQMMNTDFHNRLLNVKSKIAEGYRSLLQPVTGTVSPTAQAAAFDVFQQQMLLNLGSAYNIGTIVQLKTDVTSTYHGPDPPLIFGDPVSVTAKNSKKGEMDEQVTLSTTRINLSAQDPVWTTFIFNAPHPESHSNVNVELGFKPVALEFNIREVPGIKGYKASDWLFFVTPQEQREIGVVTIPVPLRAFPVPPVLKSQDSPDGLQETELTIDETRKWEYNYVFQRSEAAQDLLYSSVRFNVDRGPVKSSAGENNLFFILASWTTFGDAMMSDLRTYLAQLSLTSAAELKYLCKKLMIDYLWVAEYAAGAWPVWLELRDKKYPPAKNVPGDVEYRMNEPREGAKTENGLNVFNQNDYFYFDIQCIHPSEGIEMPFIRLSDKTIHPTLIPPAGIASPVDFTRYYFWKDSGGQKQYLHIRDITDAERKIIFGKYTGPGNRESFGDWLDIMQRWNAWGGAYLTRNEFLFEKQDGSPDISKRTNENFIYRTPTVRFINSSVPNLESSIPFDISALDAPGEQKGVRSLEQNISAMLYNFFGRNASVGVVRIKIQWKYRYCINVDTQGAEPLFVTLPGGIILPFRFTAPYDWEDCEAHPGNFSCRFAATIREWIQTNQVPGKEADASLRFDVTAFSDISESKLPFYRLRELFLALKDVIL